MMVIIYLLSILFQFWLCVVCETAIVEVDNLIDSTPSVDNCNGGTTGKCNLRSAWDYCNKVTSECVINLPELANISMNVADFGSLAVNSTVHINLSGSQSIITNSDIGSFDPFIYYDSSAKNSIISFPTVSINNITFTKFSFEIFYTNGNIRLSMSEVKFYNNIGPMEGNIVVFQNLQGYVTLSHCAFANNTALHGSIVIKDSSHTIISHTDIYNSGGSNGGAIYASKSNNISINSLYATVFPIHTGQYGTGVYLGENNTAIVMEGLTCSGFNSTYGGALHIGNFNSDITLSNITISDSIARIYGGGMFIGSHNQRLILTNIITNHTKADVGGAIYIEDFNTDITVTNLMIMQANASSYVGGLLIGNDNSNMRLDRITATAVSASIIGGSICFFEDNHNVTITKVTLSHVQAAYYGAGLYLQDYNVGFIIADIEITQARTTYGGGGAGMYIGYYNSDIVVTNISISHSTASLGGGIFIADYNNDIMITNMVISHCDTPYGLGGGVFLGKANAWIQFVDGNITHCNAIDGIGGGMFIGDNNLKVHIVSTTISFNTAYDGGGIYLTDGNTEVLLAGVSIQGNIACGSDGCGGGLFVNGNNPQFAIMDVESYSHFTIVESSHPYVRNLSSTVFTENVTFPVSCQVILMFDSATSINLQGGDMLTIYNRMEPILTISVYYPDYPGITLPPFITDTDFLRIELTTSSYTFGGSGSWYGFKLYITPTMPDAKQISIISGNTANATIDVSTQQLAGMSANHGGGIYIANGWDFPIFVNTIFSSNAANGKGGGLYARVYVTGLSAIAATFMNNTSILDGAGVCLSMSNFGNVFRNCVFANNRVLPSVNIGNGGAIACVSSNGVGSFVQYNEVVFLNSSFEKNMVESAGGSGGAIYFGNENEVIITNCVFVDNKAAGSDSFGGAMMIDISLNHLTLVGTTFTHNYASSSGGGIYIAIANTVTFQNLQVLHNEAGTVGGGLCMNGGGNVEFVDDVEFGWNVAAVAGGAIAAMNAYYWKYDGESSSQRMVLHNNRAGRGSAVYLWKMKSGTMQYLSFDNNTAVVAGTVYWICDDVMSNEPLELMGSSNDWGINFAPISNKSATQAIRMTGPSHYEATVYEGSLDPPLIYQLFDYYHTLIATKEISTFMSVVLVSSTANCFGVLPYLSGIDGNGVAVVNGMATLDQMQAYCYPNGNFTILLTAQLGSVLSIASQIPTSYYLQNTTFISFRSCVAGEYEYTGVCRICSQRTYSLSINSKGCEDCSQIDGISDCFSNQIYLKNGYWRRYDTTTAVMKCPGGTTSCLGGNETGNLLCAIGYEGPLCAVCSNGYYRYSSVQCNECQGSGVFSPTFIVCIVCAVLVAVLSIVYIYNSALTMLIDTAVSHSLIKQLIDFLILIYQWWQTEKKVITTRIKIVIGTFQVVSVIGTVFNVTLPISFSSFLNSWKIMNFNFSSMFPIGCANHLDFIQTMIIIAIVPLGLIGSLWIGMWIEYKIAQYTAIQRKEVGLDIDQLFVIIRSKYMNYIFYVTYLVLPSVTTTLFQIFLCTNIDPNNEGTSTTATGVTDDQYSESSLYLTADMSISCTSTYYYEGVIFSTIMIFIYPIGIPSLLLWLLYQNREEIMHRNEPPVPIEDNKIKDTRPIEIEIELQVMNPIRDVSVVNEKNIESTESHTDVSIEEGKSPETVASDKKGTLISPCITTTSGRVLSLSTSSLSFLWLPYQPHLWYWEIVDTSRRMILTAILSVTFPGSAKQNIIAIYVITMYLVFYAYVKPYANEYSNILSDIGLYQVFFTFFGATIFQNNLLTGQDADVFGNTLIVMNISILFMTMRFLYLDYTKSMSLKMQKKKTPPLPALEVSLTVPNKPTNQPIIEK